MNVDLFDLERFVTAQDTYDSYHTALQEVKDGWKQSHWMWYVFPQIQGLGHSSTSMKYSIKSLLEAKAYLEHDTLGERLREIVNALPIHGDAEEIFGKIDAMKLRSCRPYLTSYLLMKSSQIFWRTISTRSVVRKPFRLCHQSCPIIRETTHSEETGSRVKNQEPF